MRTRARLWTWTRGVRAFGCLVGVLAGIAGAPLSAWGEPSDYDKDTISDTDEGAPNLDTDGDKTPDYQDLDSDGDGISDALEAGDSDINTPPVDTDGDKIPDFQDVDSDNDGVPDAVEDANGNGLVDPGETDSKSADTDKDGLPDGEEDKNQDGAVDPGECDPLNIDTDGDGIKDGQDKCCDQPEDFDGLQDDDGCPEIDADLDGVPDVVELGHRCLKPLNPDTDGDGLLDGQEDRNGNGVVDPGETDPCKSDTDGDGINDKADKCPLEPEDFDGFMDRDGCPEVNYDGGGFPDAGADGAPPQTDTDGDGLPDELERTHRCLNWQNPDTDGDGARDGDEDKNHNGIVDPGETDPCVAEIIPRGGVGCSIESGPAAGVGALLVLLLILAVLGAAARERCSR